MNRRIFLQQATAAGLGVALGLSKSGIAQTVAEPAWKTYEVTTDVEVLHPAGETRLWIPLALTQETPFQRLLETRVECETGEAKTEHLGPEQTGVVSAAFRPGARPVLKVTQRVATRDWRVDLAAREQARSRHSGDVARYLQPTEYVPTNGIVKQRADEIAQGTRTDVEKAHAIYTWVIENTQRDAKVRGCGRGNVKAMLETGNLSGKCADLNGLFVGLVRACGVPARDVYGIRVGPSGQGFKSLGTKTDDSTKAQHCRAEVYLHTHGWVPMDPADVRKVILEEPPGTLTLTSDEVQRARERLFGGWEMNWMAYNYAQDVRLPGSTGPALPFFMYPVAETSEGRLDSLDPAAFRYAITARRLTSADAAA